VETQVRLLSKVPIVRRCGEWQAACFGSRTQRGSIPRSPTGLLPCSSKGRAVRTPNCPLGVHHGPKVVLEDFAPWSLSATFVGGPSIVTARARNRCRFEACLGNFFDKGPHQEPTALVGIHP